MRHRLLLQGTTVAVLVAGLNGTAPAASTDSGAPGCPELGADAVTSPHDFRYGLTKTQLQTDYLSPTTGLAASGFRAVRLAGYQSGDEVRYALRMVKTAGLDSRAFPGLTAPQLVGQIPSYKATHRMTDLAAFNTPDGVRYNVIWEKNTGVGWRYFDARTAAQMANLIVQQKADGYAPERVEGYRNDDGDLRFISLWRYTGTRCQWQMHVDASAADHQDAFDSWTSLGYRQVHVDATSVTGTDGDAQLRYHGIWWQQPGPSFAVHVDEDWYRFAARNNNRWCAGYATTNFYATDHGTGVRYGAIRTFRGLPAIGAASPLSDRLRKEVDCVPGRAGAAVINLTTGQGTFLHADQSFATSSTTKSAILHAVLRKADAEGFTLPTRMLDVGAQLGANQGPDRGGPESGPLQVGRSYTLDLLAGLMIDFSNNWATNRLVLDVLGDGDVQSGLDAVNAELAALGLTETRLDRYMMGTGAPSAYGNGSPGDDYEDGHDNVTTPREYATFLGFVHENAGGLLSATSHAKFWEKLGLNGNNHDDVLTDGVDADWPSLLTVASKAGSNHWGWDTSVNPWVATGAVGDYAHRPQTGPHVQWSEAGRLSFADGQDVVYAVFVNEARNVDTDAPVVDFVSCVVVEVAREYSGTTTGDDLPECQ